MLTEHFREVSEAVAQLPAEQQDQLADALADAMRQLAQQQAPTMRQDVRAAFEIAMRKHAATLDYLKDR